MTLPIRHTVRDAVQDAVVKGVAVLTGSADDHPGAPLVPLHFANGPATAPRALPRQGFGLAARLLTPPGTWAVIYLPGGEQRIYTPSSHWILGIGPGAILAQWVDARRQQLPVGLIEGWSADKWRVALWLIGDVEVIDPAGVAAHADPLGALVAAARIDEERRVAEARHRARLGEWRAEQSQLSS